MMDHAQNVENAGRQLLAARAQYENADKTMQHALAEMVRWAKAGGAALLAGEYTTVSGFLTAKNTGQVECVFCTLDCRHIGWAVDADGHVVHLCCGYLQ
jgi:hypothetical protein